MSEWAPKRFWKEARAEELPGGGFTVTLDARRVKTPAKADLVLPTRALAEAIAAEWDAQEEKIDPHRMPLTRAANSAIDKVAVQREEVAELIAAYGGSDLLCYRATGPEALVSRQAEHWDPILDWAREKLGAPLVVTAGVIHVEQPRESIAALSARVAALSPFELAALHDLVALSGSLVLGLAVAEGAIKPARAWSLSRIDEDYQAELWGHDEEAAEAAEIKRAAFLQAHRFWTLVTVTG